MKSVAKYRGVHPAFGVSRNSTYTLEMTTVKSEHGAPYLWVRIAELPEYLMPYESMMALLYEWDFTVSADRDETPLLDQLDLMERWMEIYVPNEQKAVV